MLNKHYQYAITRTPPDSMANGITTQDVVIDLQLARRQHQFYVAALQDLGISVTVLGPEELYPDSHFVEDAAIIHNEIAILTRPGAEARRGEVVCLVPALQNVLTVRQLGGDERALVDGGDVLFVGDRVYIGISDRTNIAGAEQLKNALTSIDPRLSIHFISFSGVLHLKSGLTALGPNLLIGSPAIKLHDPLPIADIVWLPDAEGYAANTLSVNGAVLYFAECQSAREVIMAAGLKPVALDMSEFRKMDGSFTCLSLLW